MPFDVQFISFDDILENPKVLDDAGVIINAGDAYTAFSGGDYWKDARIVSAYANLYTRGAALSASENRAQHKGRSFFQLL